MQTSPQNQQKITTTKLSGHIAILLCTYNGERFLKEQLDSIANQTHENWSLYVSDDGSTDNTLQIVENFKSKLAPGRVTLFQGPKQGFAKNFMSLAKCNYIEADFFAFSDQDDIWFEDKLERSVKYLSNSSSSQPALYCSRTRLVNMTGEVIGLSPLFSNAPSFRNALVQSLAGANTMLVNRDARNLLSQTPDDAKIPAHDWLAYLLVSGAGGYVVFDKTPSLDYRQHDNNLIGSNSGVTARISRLIKMFSGRFKNWNTQNIYILETMQNSLSTENRLYFENFRNARGNRLAQRVRFTIKSGVYRQTLAGKISLWAAVILNKL
jgi:glycosyltransferase involved in cell wall biosynthesis